MVTTSTLGRSVSSAPSRYLMLGTYVVGGLGLAASFAALGSGSASTAGAWASGLVVGGCGVLSFVRHSLLHRSDAVRMGWDLGRRNDFQIEVGLANLAIGVGGIAAMLLGDASARAVVVAVYGVYLLGAAALHASELPHDRSVGGRRWASTAATVGFGVALLACAALLQRA